MIECPVPARRYERIVMGHGSGGRLTADLIQQLILPRFRDPALAMLEDQATLQVGEARLAFSTDAFVVRPLFFPGGDIGKLAVYGTVNDLAVGGATPLFLSAALIMEEGLPIQELERVLESMSQACAETGVALVTGDTKVVERGKGDKLFITTAGIGSVPRDVDLSVSSARPGDKVLVSGTLGDHGIAILSVREGLELETRLESDCAPIVSLAQALLRACPRIRCMRDPSRGGVASVVNEIARASGVGIELFEEQLPMRQEVRSACELFGLDALYVANEGKLIAVVPPDHVDSALTAMRELPLGREARMIGVVTDEHPNDVVLHSVAGGARFCPS